MKKKKVKITLTTILKSYAVGLTIHLSYSMIIVSFRIFNFFTAYLPFMIFDAIFLIYIYIKTDIIKDKIKDLNKLVILNYLKRNKENISIISIAVVMLFLLLMSFIDRSVALNGKDPYYWFAQVYFIHENGYLNYKGSYTRPPGYILMCASILSITDNFYDMYFFIKYSPLFFMCINLLVIFEISRSIFKKKIYIFFTLAIFLSFSYFISRNIMALPSNLAMNYVFILMLFMKKSILSEISSNDNQSLKKFIKIKFMDKNIIFKGMLLAGTFMAHGLYWFYFFVFYLSYEILILIVNLITNKRIKKENFEIFTKFIIIICSIIIYMTIFSLPGIICVSVYANRGILTFYRYLTRYFPSVGFFEIYIHKNLTLSLKNDIYDFFQEISEYLIKDSIYSIPNDFFKDIFFELPFISDFKKIYTYTLSLGILLVFFGAFLKYNKNSDLRKKDLYLINFIRFTFIFVIVIIPIIFLIEFIEIPIFQDIANFYGKYGKRLYEIFPGFWSIIFVLSVDYLFKITKNLYFKIKKTKIKPSKGLIHTFKVFQLVTIIFLSGFFYVTNYERVSYGTVHDSNRTRMLMFIGNYFHENPLEEKTVILLEELKDTETYRILAANNLEKELFSYSFLKEWEYDEFIAFFDEHDCDYILFPKFRFDEDGKFMEEFEEDFDIIHEISKFSFAKEK